jgi:hypothetical protein
LPTATFFSVKKVLEKYIDEKNLPYVIQKCEENALSEQETVLFNITKITME